MRDILIGLTLLAFSVGFLAGAFLWWHHISGYNRRIASLLFGHPRFLATDASSLRLAAESFTRWFCSIFLTTAGLFALAGALRLIARRLSI